VALPALWLSVRMRHLPIPEMISEEDAAPDVAGGGPPPAGDLTQDGGLVRAAAVLALGNVASRILGLGRETVKARFFGTVPALSAFEIAAVVPTTLYDLIVGGMVNSSLVPVFSEYAAKEERDELWAVASTFLSVAAVVLLLVVLLVELFTAPVVAALGAFNFTDPALTARAIALTRLSAPVVFFLSISSILTGLLYALKRFTLPAFTGALFNGVIVAAVLIRPDHIESLVWGMLAGSLLQVAVQLPALREARLRWRFDWRHPAIRRILRLYTPIVAGLVVNQAGIAIGYNLATLSGDRSLTYMRYATTLYQFPQGLVVTALSIAILPTLSEQASGLVTTFRRTLAQGLRLVVTLILPATAGLFALALPIVTLLFEGGRFTPDDSQVTALALRLFLFGLPFAAVDQMLIFASYARKDTLRPALVGVASIAVYVAVAAYLVVHLERWWPAAWSPGDQPVGLYGLMIADAVKHLVHTLLMLPVLNSQIGGLPGEGLATSTVKSLLAALATAGVAWLVAGYATRLIGFTTTAQQLLVVTVAGLGGIGVYGLLVHLLDLREARLLRHLLRR
jgi:putative peptidoglycan lipid II flippase